MKKWNVAVALSLAFVSVACGDKKEEDPPSTLRQCKDTCESAAECDSTPSDYEENCRDLCRATETLVEDAGCESEFEDLWACSGTDVDCDATDPNDECESEAEDFVACLQKDSGDGI